MLRKSCPFLFHEICEVLAVGLLEVQEFAPDHLVCVRVLCPWCGAMRLVICPRWHESRVSRVMVVCPCTTSAHSHVP